MIFLDQIRDSSTRCLTSDPTEVLTHDHQIMTVHFQVIETSALTTRPLVTIIWRASLMYYQHIPIFLEVIHG